MLLESAMSSAKASLSFAEVIHYKPSKDTFAEDNEASAKGISPTVSEALRDKGLCESAKCVDRELGRTYHSVLLWTLAVRSDEQSARSNWGEQWFSLLSARAPFQSGGGESDWNGARRHEL